MEKYQIPFKNCIPFPVYSVMDLPTPYSGAVQCDMYYVNSENKIDSEGVVGIANP